MYYTLHMCAARYLSSAMSHLAMFGMVDLPEGQEACIGQAAECTACETDRLSCIQIFHCLALVEK
jgi:hypothetical protein